MPSTSPAISSVTTPLLCFDSYIPLIFSSVQSTPADKHSPRPSSIHQFELPLLYLFMCPLFLTSYTFPNPLHSGVCPNYSVEMTFSKSDCSRYYCVVLGIISIVQSGVWFFETRWTVACQAPWSMGFCRQEYWRGLPFPSPEELPNSGIKHGSPAWQMDSLPLNHLETTSLGTVTV